MAKIRRIVRKLRPPPGGFDDQFWPVMVALVVLSGFLVGIILALPALAFDEPRILFNRTTYLALLAFVVAAVAVVLWQVENRIVRRVIEFSAILSLAVHVLIGVLIFCWTLPTLQEEATVADARQKPRKQITVPEYHEFHFQPTEQPRRDFEKPVETQFQDERPIDVERQRNEPEEAKAKPQPAPVPEQETAVRPNAVKRPVPSESVPRQSDEPSRLSRHTAQPKPQPIAAVAAPKVKTAVETPRNPNLQAQATDVARAAAEAQVRPKSSDAEPVADQTHQTPSVARREITPDQVADSQAAPTLQRKVSDPQALPRTTAAASQETPAAARQTAESALQPSNTESRRMITSSPEIARKTLETPPEAATQITRQNVTRQQQAEQGPTLASTPKPVSSRRPQAVERPDVTTVANEVPVTTGPAASKQGELAPSAASLTRRAIPSPAESKSPSIRPVPAASAEARLARAPTGRARTSDVPTMRPSDAPTNTPARTLRTALTAASPAAVSAPAAADTTRTTQRPQAEPARTALTRSFQGTAGIGRSPNMDRGLPASTRTALAASGAARRERATQRGESGPAVSPSAPARIQRHRAGADAPSATLAAQPIENATFAGVDRPADIEVSAGAAIERAAANAAEGPVTASRGSVEVDLGPTRVVSNTGRGRASGGGQPTLNFDTRSRKIARAETGGAPQPSIAAAAVAATPVAPQGTGGGQPASIEASFDATATLRTEAGGNLPTSGGPTSPDAVGPTELASSARAIGRAEIGRAQTVDAAPAAPDAGGGTLTRTRTATGPAPSTTIEADVIAVAGRAPASSGAREGVSLDVQGTQTAKAAAGVAGRATADPVGALAGPSAIDAPASATPGSLNVGRRRSSPSSDDGPAVAELENLGGPRRRTGRTSLPSGVAAQIEVPVAGLAEAAATGGSPAVRDAAAGEEVASRQAVSGLPVDIAAPEGPGGLAAEEAPDAGTMARRAHRDVLEIHFRSIRFRRAETGGPLAMNVTAATGTDAFSGRKMNEDEPGGGESSPPPKTEEAVELGLRFLARQQLQDGSWSLSRSGAPESGYEGEEVTLHSDTGATGLVLLAFLGAGYEHQTDRYQDVVRRGIEYLIENQKEDGDLYVPQDSRSDAAAWLYSHGIAAIALCEAYGMTQDPKLREPAQKALDFIVQSQQESRGGWRYSPHEKSRASDTSVTGWLMMALKSGELAGLDVPEKTYAKIDKWLDMAQASKTERHLYAYNPFAKDNERQGHGRLPSKTMTPVALLMRLYRGWRRDNPHMIAGADYLLENLPAHGTRNNNLRDTYYWYYATQVMYHMGDKYWDAWNGRLHPLLVNSQVKEGPTAGSWDPRRPVPDRWGPQAGRIYVTTLNLLSLEVYYRHLPIYVETAK